MKRQIKYAFLAGLSFRGPVFIVIFMMNSVFIGLGLAESLPFPAHVTAVSLGGIAIAVMLAANISGDISIFRKMFSAPEAYLLMLTTAPRRKTLLAGIITAAIMDTITMAFAIFAEVWLALNLAGSVVWQAVWNAAGFGINHFYSLSILFLWMMVSYIFLITVILFCVTMKKSLFFKLPASGFLAFLTACCCFFITNLLQIVLAPFNETLRYGPFIFITANSAAALPVMILLTAFESAVLFIVTSKLMERRMNI